MELTREVKMVKAELVEAEARVLQMQERNGEKEGSLEMQMLQLGGEERSCAAAESEPAEVRALFGAPEVARVRAKTDLGTSEIARVRLERDLGASEIARVKSETECATLRRRLATTASAAKSALRGAAGLANDVAKAREGQEAAVAMVERCIVDFEMVQVSTGG